MSSELAPNGLPQSSTWLFPEYDFARMNLDEYVGVIMSAAMGKRQRAHEELESVLRNQHAKLFFL